MLKVHMLKVKRSWVWINLNVISKVDARIDRRSLVYLHRRSCRSSSHISSIFGSMFIGRFIDVWIGLWCSHDPLHRICEGHMNHCIENLLPNIVHNGAPYRPSWDCGSQHCCGSPGYNHNTFLCIGHVRTYVRYTARVYYIVIGRAKSLSCDVIVRATSTNILDIDGLAPGKWMSCLKGGRSVQMREAAFELWHFPYMDQNLTVVFITRNAASLQCVFTFWLWTHLSPYKGSVPIVQIQMLFYTEMQSLGGSYTPDDMYCSKMQLHE